MKADYVIKNGIVVTPQSTIIGGVAIKGKKIVAVGSDEMMPDANRVIDANGGYVIPGLIDLHYHLGAGGPFDRGAGFVMPRGRLTRYVLRQEL